MNFNDRDSPVLNVISNENHLSDVNYSLRYTRWFLRLIGIWPLVISKPTKIEKNISNIVLPFCSISIMILTIPIASFVTLKCEDRLEMLTLLGPIVFQSSSMIKHLVMIFRSNSIKRCIQHMETDWRTIDNKYDRDCMMKNVRIGHTVTIVCALTMYCGGLMYQIILPLLNGNTINELNETVRPLAFPGPEIYVDLRTGHVYGIVFCSNCVSGLFVYTVSLATSNLAAILVSHACGQIQIVLSRLENLVSFEVKNDSIVTHNRIAVIIRYHVRLLKFITGIEQVLREICLLEMAALTLIICLLEYYCIMVWSNSDRVRLITYVTFLSSFSFNLFIYCQIGEVLQEQCEEVGKAAYMIEWYKLPGKSNLALIMIITMGNYSRKLTAGGIMELSIAAFAKIMKSSFVYMNMLKTVA